MTNCKECTKYYGDCGFHFVDRNGHINYDCPSESRCDKTGNCMEFSAHPNVTHTFTFTTSHKWNPENDTCRGECPFSSMIGIGRICRFKDKACGFKCPFLNTKYEMNSSETLFGDKYEFKKI